MADHGWQPASSADVQEFLTWRYSGDDAVYDLSDGDGGGQVEWFLSPAVACHVLHDSDGRVEAFCTFGEDARVPGGDYGAEALDVGIGTRPDLVGGGGGVERTQSLLALAAERFGVGPRRVTIAAWNRRAQRVASATGFAEVSRFTRQDGAEFVVLLRP